MLMVSKNDDEGHYNDLTFPSVNICSVITFIKGIGENLGKITNVNHTSQTFVLHYLVCINAGICVPKMDFFLLLGNSKHL